MTQTENQNQNQDQNQNTKKALKYPKRIATNGFLSIAEILYGLNDKVVLYDTQKTYKIYYNSKGMPYFNYNKSRLYLNDFIKTYI